MNIDSFGSPPPPLDQRRARRHKHRLPVDLHSRAGEKRLWTHDVGAYGLFLLMKEPPRERHVLKLTVHLPSGPIGVVAHGTHSSPFGMGVQFFALAGEAKRRWDGFLAELGGAPTDVPVAAQDGEPRFGEAAFVVKLKTLEALRDFADNCLKAGGTYLRTPVLKAVGSPVVLTMVHPTTDSAIQLRGTVERLHQQRPKGMEIRFETHSVALSPTFDDFIRTGQAPPTPLDDRGLDEPAVRAAMNRRAVASLEEEQFDIDVLVDTALEEATLPEDQRFAWEEVSGDLTIDIGIGDDLDSFLPKSTDAALSFPVGAGGNGSVTSLASTSAGGFLGEAAIRVSCDSCEMNPVVLPAGRAKGPMGLVAEHRCYFCPRCAVPMSTLRARSLGDRENERKSAGAGGHVVQLPMSVFFDLATLSDPAVCLRCKTRLKQTKSVQLLEKAVIALLAKEKHGPERIPCGACKSGTWQVDVIDDAARAMA